MFQPVWACVIVWPTRVRASIAIAKALKAFETELRRQFEQRG
jgi:hypothetical protein